MAASFQTVPISGIFWKKKILTDVIKGNKETNGGDLEQNYWNFWQPDNSLNHTVMRNTLISVEGKLNLNVRKM